MPTVRKRILVAPLDWGLGHATRCIPIVQMLLQRGHEVVLASSGDAATLLHTEFPLLPIYPLPPYCPIYPEDHAMVRKMAWQLPKFIQVIMEEQRAVEKIATACGIDVIISDNRYGCYSKKVKSVIITHQVTILMPDRWKWIEKTVNRFNHLQIKKFAECWIPADNARLFPLLLQGRTTLPHRFIGYLSRFTPATLSPDYGVVAIASGPSPQREKFVALLAEQLKLLPEKTLLIRGAWDNKEPIISGNYAECAHMNSQELNRVVATAKVVVCRSGYSSVMDLMTQRVKAIFIPTPGQTEQEYIASVLDKKGIAFASTQKGFDLAIALKKSSNYTGFALDKQSNVLLAKAIDSL